MDQEKSVAHKRGMNWVGQGKYPDGLVDWRDATPPNIAAGQTTGGLRSCGYCGSMHPADVAAAIRAGAKGHWADFKYGWPHKAYFDDIPNPHAGQLESRMSSSHVVPDCPKTGAPCGHGRQSFNHPQCECLREAPELVRTGKTEHGDSMIAVPDGFSRDTGKPDFRWIEVGKPAAATTYGKFYTVHLQDASPEDREVIEKHLGLHFEFDGQDRVSWSPIT